MNEYVNNFLNFNNIIKSKCLLKNDKLYSHIKFILFLLFALKYIKNIDKTKIEMNNEKSFSL
jgi:hypothetical protein